MNSNNPPTNSDTPAWIGMSGDGVTLRILVQPRSSITEIIGPHGVPPRLKMRVSAPPVDREANEEVIRFLSKRLGIPKWRISLTRGDASKQKDIFLQGVTLSTVLSMLKGKK